MIEKYRAKQKTGGEWVAGTYIPTRLTSNDYIFHFIEVYGEMNGEKVRHKFSVKPDTLSRCSGLTAGGQELYEGDIVRFHIDHTTEFWTAVVRFGWHDTYEYGWYLEPIRDTVFTKTIGAWLGERPAFGSTAAVIGNVWDNPEMMEGWDEPYSKQMTIIENADRCVCCGDVIPEGRQVCPACEGGEPT